MFLKTGWEESLMRWRAFWEGQVADRPPVLIHRMAAFASDISGSREVGPNTVLARNLAFYDPAQNEGLLAQMEQGLEARAEMPDDMAPSVVAGGGVHFAGAAFGAPVKVTASMLTSEPIIQDWSQAEGIRFDMENDWVQRAMGLARQVVARGVGRYAVTVGLLEGPSDICAALRGITELAEDIYSHPAEVRNLAERAAEAWVTYAHAMHEIVPLYDGGTVTQWSIWTPGRGAAFQEDFCTVISPRTYREFFKPLDQQLAREVDLFWVHVHAGEIHLVEELLTMDEVRGVQIVHDGDASPPLERVLTVMKRVQKRGKCLIVRKYSPEELETILPHLSPKGLAIDTYCPTVEAAQRFVKRLEAWPFGKV